jgi:hypothetical protein
LAFQGTLEESPGASGVARGNIPIGKRTRKERKELHGKKRTLKERNGRERREKSCMVILI